MAIVRRYRKAGKPNTDSNNDKSLCCNWNINTVDNKMKWIAQKANNTVDKAVLHTGSQFSTNYNAVKYTRIFLYKCP